MSDLARYQEIERSIITTYRSKLWGPFIRALKTYELLKPNDHVCVCISGGKDSFLMAKLFQELERHSDFAFSVTFMVMDPGYKEENRALIISNAKEMNIPITIIDSDIFEITDKMAGKPCYLCARMRRGCLYKHAKELGCNKIALGHHFNDVIETTLMSILYNGKIQGMMPKLHSENYEGMELIRPLYLIEEKDIIAWQKYNDLKFLQCACKLTSNSLEYETGAMDSKRKEMKNLIKDLKKINPNVDANIFSALQNISLDTCVAFDFQGQHYNFLNDYDKRKKNE